MPEDRKIRLKTTSISYRDWGGDGPPLILLHGLASNLHIFDLLAPLLSQSFHVIALDQRGHGQSGKPNGDYGFATFVNDLHEFLQAIDLKQPTVLGHSWGGNVALEYASRHPRELVGLVMVDGGFLHFKSIPDITWERAKKEFAPPDLGNLSMEQLLVKAKQEWDIAPYWNSSVENAIRENFIVRADNTITPRLKRSHHAKILRALWDQDGPRLCREVICPTLLIPAYRNRIHTTAALDNSGKHRGQPENRPRGGRLIQSQVTNFVRKTEENLARSHTEWIESSHDIPLQAPSELSDIILSFLLHRAPQM